MEYDFDMADDFTHHLEAMRAHYKMNSNVEYALPKRLVMSYQTKSDKHQEVETTLKGVVKNDLVESNKRSERKIQNAAEEYISG